MARENESARVREVRSEKGKILFPPVLVIAQVSLRLHPAQESWLGAVCCRAALHLRDRGWVMEENGGLRVLENCRVIPRVSGREVECALNVPKVLLVLVWVILVVLVLVLVIPVALVRVLVLVLVILVALVLPLLPPVVLSPLVVIVVVLALVLILVLVGLLLVLVLLVLALIVLVVQVRAVLSVLV